MQPWTHQLPLFGVYIFLWLWFGFPWRAASRKRRCWSGRLNNLHSYDSGIQNHMNKSPSCIHWVDKRLYFQEVAESDFWAAMDEAQSSGCTCDPRHWIKARWCCGWECWLSSGWPGSAITKAISNLPCVSVFSSIQWGYWQKLPYRIVTRINKLMKIKPLKSVRHIGSVQ